MKKLITMLLSLVFVGTIGAFVGCSNTADADKQAYVSIDINPTIELIVDEYSNVVSVRGENEDGQAILYQEAEIEGKSIDEAIQRITDLAIEYGYLSEENKVVETLVSSKDNEFAEKILEKINTKITAKANELGISVSTNGKGAYSLVRKFEEFKKQYPNNQVIQNLTISKFKLALSVSGTGEITLEAAVELDDTKLIEMLKKASEKMEDFATEEYKKVKEQALEIYDKATQIAGYGAYSEYYMENVLRHPLTAYYGGAYQLYATAGRAFESICNIAKLKNKVEDYPLTEEQVTTIVSVLGLENGDVLKNADGIVTVKSVEAYVDVLFKNLPESEELEQTKQALSEALAQVESVIKEELDTLGEEYAPQIEEALAVAKQINTAVQTVIEHLPENIKQIMNTIFSDFNTIIADVEAIINGGEISIEQLQAKAGLFNQKAEGYLELIKAELTERELKDIEERKQKKIDAMASHRQEMEQTIDQAANKAKEHLHDLREQRRDR